MISETLVVKTKSLDPWHNLAVEEYLLDNVKEQQCILYLWQNQNTVVIGKNQNPWKECRTELLEKEGGRLARRLSGGGAVFHDMGNLNFTFLLSKENYDLKRQVEVILSAVKKLGIAAEMSGRNDLTVEGHKFSGNAFCFRKNNAYHHGTILISADLENLTKYLQVSQEKIKSKGIESVRSRVVNLSEYNPSLTIDKVAEAFSDEFNKAYGGNASIIYDTDYVDGEVIKELYTKYSSWEWRYGEAPKFDMDLMTRFPWGGIELGLKLEKGKISVATVYSDAMDEEFIGMLPSAFKGQVLNSSILSENIRAMDTGEERKQMKEDIATWLENKEF